VTAIFAIIPYLDEEGSFMTDNTGKLILRIMLGSLMLFHGVNKLQQGIEFIKGLVVAQGLPEFLAYGVYIGELVAPVLLLLGWRSRIWAGVIAVNMLVVIYLTQMGAFMKLGAHGSWAVELQMFYLFSALAIAFMGSGKFAVTQD
jgi:putative oxidoreductase